MATTGEAGGCARLAAQIATWLDRPEVAAAVLRQPDLDALGVGARMDLADPTFVMWVAKHGPEQVPELERCARVPPGGLRPEEVLQPGRTVAELRLPGEPDSEDDGEPPATRYVVRRTPFLWGGRRHFDELVVAKDGRVSLRESDGCPLLVWDRLARLPPI